MSDRTLKDLRKQLRNIAKDILPEVLSDQLVIDLERRLSEKINARCDAIAKHIDTVLKAIDQRQQDVQSYILRNTTHVPVPVKSDEDNKK